MKPTRIINIETITHLAGFKDLPMVVETEKANYRILVGDLIGKIHADTFSHGADINMQVSTMKNFQPNFNPVTKLLSMVRYDKSMQAVYLAHFMESLEEQPELYHPLKTYSSSPTGGFPRTVPEGEYMIKPSSGARSMAMFKLDTSKIHIREFTNLLDISIKKYGEHRENVNSEATLDAPKDGLSEPVIEKKNHQITKTEWLDTFFKNNNIEYSRGTEFDDHEAADNVFSRRMIAQEYNPYADAHCFELRALRCVGAKPLIYERQDLKEGYVGYSKEFTGSGIAQTMWNEIQYVLRHPDFPSLFGSVDIWVNSEEHKWGIYEYQPEYCSVNIRQEDHDAFLERALDGLWGYCYN